MKKIEKKLVWIKKRIDKEIQGNKVVSEEILEMKISDEDLEEEVEKLGDNVPVIDTEEVLSDKCDDVLKSDPKFTVNPKLDSIKQEIEVEIAICQLKWDQSQKEWLKEKLNVIKEVNPNNTMDISDVKAAEEEEDVSWDEDTKKLLMSRKRVTALKSNKRIILPKPLDDDKEHQLLKLKKTVMEETRAYIEENVVKG